MLPKEVDYYVLHFAYSEDDRWRQVINREVRRHLESLRIRRYSLRINPHLGNLQLRLQPKYYPVFVIQWNPRKINILEYHTETVYK